MVWPSVGLADEGAFVVEDAAVGSEDGIIDGENDG